MKLTKQHFYFIALMLKRENADNERIDKWANELSQYNENFNYTLFFETASGVYD